MDLQILVWINYKAFELSRATFDKFMCEIKSQLNISCRSYNGKYSLRFKIHDRNEIRHMEQKKMLRLI